MAVDPIEIARSFFSGVSAVAAAIKIWEFSRDKKKAAQAFDATYESTLTSNESAVAAKQLIAIIPPEVIQDLEKRADRCWTGYRLVLGGDYLPDEVDAATDSVQGCVCREIGRIKKLNGCIPERWQDQWERFDCAHTRREATKTVGA
jgi:hypothetical protein